MMTYVNQQDAMTIKQQRPSLLDGNDKILRASTRCIHIASGDGNNNINGNDDEECRQQGLVLKLTTYSYRIAQWRR
jgi:hypothetical protein